MKSSKGMNERIQQTCVEAAPWLRVVAGAKFSGAFVCDCYESGGAWPAWHHATAPPPPESPIRSFKQSSTHSTLVTQQTKSFVTNKFRAPTFLYKRLKVYTNYFWPSPVLGWSSSQPTSLLLRWHFQQISLRKTELIKQVMKKNSLDSVDFDMLSSWTWMSRFIM